MGALLLAAAVITAALFGYLFFALLYPEKLQ
jgi:K+-transporting ATPase KdpF subunit